MLDYKPLGQIVIRIVPGHKIVLVNLDIFLSRKSDSSSDLPFAGQIMELVGHVFMHSC